MKKITTILISLLITGFAIANDIDNIPKREFLEFKKEFTDSINSLNHKLDESNEKFKIQESANQNRFKDASNMIDYQNNLVGSFGVIFTVLTILIALLTLGLPILTYQFGIKPSQKALRDIEINMDSRLEKYLKENRDKQIEQALANLKSDSTELRTQGLNFLALTHHQGLTDAQMFKLFYLVKKNMGEQSVKSQLSFVLSTRKNEYADELFNDEMYLDDKAIKPMALMYFVKTGFENNISGLKKIMSLSSNKSTEYFNILINIMTYASGDLLKALNCQELISGLDKPAISDLKGIHKHYLKTLNISHDKFEETELYKTIKDHV